MIFSHLALALLPVCLFLLTLLYLDSYKLVRLQTIAELVIIGCVIAALSLFINWILETHGVDRRVLLRFGAPAVEEILKALPLVFLPGLLTAFAIHSLFNHFVVSPVMSAIVIVVLLPPMLILVFSQSERYLQLWLGSGFDLDSELLRVIGSGEFGQSPAGEYL